MYLCNRGSYAVSRAMSVYQNGDKSVYEQLRLNARAAVLDSKTVCEAYFKVWP